MAFVHSKKPNERALNAKKEREAKRVKADAPETDYRSLSLGF